MVFFMRKITLQKLGIRLIIGTFLSLFEVFKTWHHYLIDYKNEVFILTHHNNLHLFILI